MHAPTRAGELLFGQLFFTIRSAADMNYKVKMNQKLCSSKLSTILSHFMKTLVLGEVISPLCWHRFIWGNVQSETVLESLSRKDKD